MSPLPSPLKRHHAGAGSFQRQRSPPHTGCSPGTRGPSVGSFCHCSCLDSHVRPPGQPSEMRESCWWLSPPPLTLAGQLGVFCTTSQRRPAALGGSLLVNLCSFAPSSPPLPPSPTVRAGITSQMQPATNPLPQVLLLGDIN